MSQTNIATGTAVTSGAGNLAVKHYSAALFANSLKPSNAIEQLMGAVDASQLATVGGQTSPGAPIVRIDNLMKNAGDTVSLDLVDTISGEPLMGDVNREGQGSPLSFSSMEIKIDLMSKVVDAGGAMSQQRTKHNLREIALAQLSGYFPRLNAQLALVHLAGARGSQTGADWIVPLQSGSSFNSILVNPVKAPTYNRHYVVNGTGLTQGGAQLASVTTTDDLTLAHIDKLRLIIDEMDYPLQPVKLSGDRAADTSKMWVLLVSPKVYSNLLTEGSLRAFQQNAVNRSAYFDVRHPLFAGEVGMWNGILVVKNERAIRFAANATTKHYANSTTTSETDVTIAAGLSTNYVVERSLLLGAQALGIAYGKTKTSGMQFGWKEHWYNFESNLEVMGEKVCGYAKTQFLVDNGTGTRMPTDFGVIAVDAVVPV